MVTLYSHSNLNRNRELYAMKPSFFLSMRLNAIYTNTKS